MDPQIISRIKLAAFGDGQPPVPKRVAGLREVISKAPAAG